VPQVIRILTAGMKRCKNTNHKLKFVGVGGDIVDSDLLRSLADWIPKSTQVLITYGTTEVAGFSIFRKLTSTECINIDVNEAVHLGDPVDSTELKLVQENVENTGELAIVCKQVCIKSITTGSPTKLLFKKSTSGERGIYNTGDIVETIGKRMIFKGRKNREIIRNGQRIQLEQLENIFSKATESTCALLENDGKLTMFVERIARKPIEQLIQQTEYLVPNFLIPTDIRYVELIPRNSRGKIDFAECSKLLL